MKKAISLALLMLALAGCKKKEQIYQQDLDGTWKVYKYLLYNIDQTSQFNRQYNSYLISFTSSGTFTESFLLNSDTPSIVRHGTYRFLQNDQVIALDDTMYIPIDSVHVYDSIFERQYTFVRPYFG